MAMLSKYDALTDEEAATLICVDSVLIDPPDSRCHAGVIQVLFFMGSKALVKITEKSLCAYACL